jgi:primosomal protein N' (replication factor Y) (superfamily II helicase)
MMKKNTPNLFGFDQAEDTPNGRVIRVSFESGVDAEFDYNVPDKLWPVSIGCRVEVPFGRKNKLKNGFCVAVLDEDDAQKSKTFKLKSVKKVLDETPLLDTQLMELARWISSYYVCPLGQVLTALVPAAVKKGAGIKKEKYVYLAVKENTDLKLTSKKQTAIIETLKNSKAFDPDSAVKKDDLLLEAGCKEGVLKTLSRNGFIKIALRNVFRSPPVVPSADSVAKANGKNIALNDDQQKALGNINSKVNTRTFGVSLLHGVTDSGKTEIYIRAIQNVVENGKSAIVLLPEIALTTQTIGRFSRRFKNIAVLHSRLTGPQRNSEWQKIKQGTANVVIGARSAVFAPLDNLGLIVVDEEHEPSYKQDTTPRYHGRDVAIKRSQICNAHCLLGSATPSLETLTNCKTKKHFQCLELPKRVMDLPMPQMQVVDLSDQFTQAGLTLISPPLESKLRQVLEKKQQAILLLNRRGYSSFIYCSSCRHCLNCKNCDVTLTFHKKPQNPHQQKTILGNHMPSGHAICHYCLAKTLVPTRCPLCNRKMTMIGLGSQRLEEELNKKFPNARISRVDSDSMQGGDAQKYYDVLSDFASGKTDILAGTQMLAKGLHFPNVTLVGIISADTSLTLPDFRANERTFQLISQVAGRTGRSTKQGTVIVQTLLPDSPAIQFALKHDYDGFVTEELTHRKKCNLPPYWRMAMIGLRDPKFDKLTAACNALRERIDYVITTNDLHIKVRGPMPATISRIQQYHRMQIILQAANVIPLQKLFAIMRSMSPIKPGVMITVDIDPINLM